MSNLAWLESLKESFVSTGLDYEDLYELIEASMARGRINFPVLIYNASRGFGFSVSEGFFTLLIRTGTFQKISMRSVSFWMKCKLQVSQCLTTFP